MHILHFLGELTPKTKNKQDVCTQIIFLRGIGEKFFTECIVKKERNQVKSP